MISIIALIVLLVCFMFIKSTIIIPSEKCAEKHESRLNILWCMVCVALCFVPYAKWIMMFAAPILTGIWFLSCGFDNYRDIKISDKNKIGKILLFKI